MDFGDYTNSIAVAAQDFEEEAIRSLEEMMIDTIESGGTIILFGNGGSLANALHIGGDYQKTFAPVGARFEVIGGNLCSLTAACNDISFEESYMTLAKPHLDAVGKKIAVFLSGSGNSLNLVKCVEYCIGKRVQTACICAYGGGKLSSICDVALSSGIRDMEVAEDLQVAVFHYIKKRLGERFLCEDSSLPKYRLRTLSNEVY